MSDADGVFRTEIPVLMLGMPAARLRSHSCRSPAYSVLSSGPASPVIPRSDAVVPSRIVRLVRVGVGASYTQKNSSLHPDACSQFCAVERTLKSSESSRGPVVAEAKQGSGRVLTAHQNCGRRPASSSSFCHLIWK